MIARPFERSVLYYIKIHIHIWYRFHFPMNVDHVRSIYRGDIYDYVP